MPVQIALNTPLAEALTQSVQPKLVEIGWGNGTDEDATLTEYIILMLINGKTEPELASDISGELLNLGPDDPAATEFARWLFQEIEAVNAQLNGVPAGSDALAEGSAMATEDKDMAMDTAGDVSGLNAPTGPRSMRQNAQTAVRGGARDRRMLGHMTRAMDRSHDPLHRIRGQTGNERINSHGRGAPTGPRGPGHAGRQQRGGMNGRTAANLQAGLNAMNQQPMHPMAGMMQNGMDGWGMNPQGPNLLAVLEQQNQLMRQMAQQLNHQTPSNGFQNRRGRGRGDHRGGGGGYGRGQHQQSHGQRAQSQQASGGSEQGDDMDMEGSKAEQSNPEETLCKFNLKCLNKDCKFAHQSPAAPPGVTIDVKDVCTFGAACKNFKCTARHPSPATRLAHQSDQDCKFYPNCQNPRCQFRHPAMPLCRNGASCTTPKCKFTHVKTKCKFNPCLNPQCAFVHEEGQQGGYKDKVWTPGDDDEEGKEHVSDRKFVDEAAETEMVTADDDADAEIIT